MLGFEVGGLGLESLEGLGVCVRVVELGEGRGVGV